MLSAANLLRDGKPIAEAIAAVATEAAAVTTALADAREPGTRAALALIAGIGRHAAAVPALLPLLADEGFAARAASWALARIGGVEVERAVLKLIADGKLDQRENGYWCLTTLAALGKASPTLADAAAQLVDAENGKARSGGSALADHACRLLGVLGDKRTAAKAEEAMEADRFCDRFELNRLIKAAADGRKDSDTIAERSVEWTVLFADQLAPAVKPVEAKPAEAKPAAKPGIKPMPKAPSAAPKAGLAAISTGAPPSYDAPSSYDTGSPYGAGDLSAEVGGDDAQLADDGGAPPAESQAPPVDWEAFAASPELAALPAQTRSLAEQLGKMIEQLAVRAVGVPLADLAGQEFLALLLQVLPQALPPQHVQTALSPQALNGYQALAKFLVRTGAATHGIQLVDAVKVVRKQMLEQIRRSGILGGPDYSDPDEKSPAPVAG